MVIIQSHRYRNCEWIIWVLTHFCSDSDVFFENFPFVYEHANDDSGYKIKFGLSVDFDDGTWDNIENIANP